MFGWFKRTFGENLNHIDNSFPKEATMKALLKTTTDGRTAIVFGGETVGTYARRRDAIRGADRKNLTLINA